MLEPTSSRFWQAALQSGLADAQALQPCWDAIPPDKRTVEHVDRRLARQAVQSGVLTLWQAQQLIAGRSTGFKIDRYVLLDLIGQGGMGRVYLARDSRLNRRVAVKILSPERVNNPRAIARFHREALVGAQLQHENLVRIYDEGESAGKCYLVMEFIEGRNIGQMIAENGPVPAPVAARLARQVALGLEHAQRKGLIHRDVNPYNILVTRDGTAKLTDLGLAIDLAETDRVTRDGATVGTFDYVSPEQARHSHSVDTRSDIYSLGCTLYHMLTGQVPFPAASLPEKLFGHQVAEPEPLRNLAPDVPEGLAAVVARMMRKAPDDRYATPKELAQALEPFADDDPATTNRGSDPHSSGRNVNAARVAATVTQIAPARHGEPPSPVPPDLPQTLVDNPPRAVLDTDPLMETIPLPPLTPPAPVAGREAEALVLGPAPAARPRPKAVPEPTPTADAPPGAGGVHLGIDLGPAPAARVPAPKSRPEPNSPPEPPPPTLLTPTTPTPEDAPGEAGGVHLGINLGAPPPGPAARPRPEPKPAPAPTPISTPAPGPGAPAPLADPGDLGGLSLGLDLRAEPPRPAPAARPRPEPKPAPAPGGGGGNGGGGRPAWVVPVAAAAGLALVLALGAFLYRTYVGGSAGAGSASASGARGGRPAVKKAPAEKDPAEVVPTVRVRRGPVGTEVAVVAGDGTMGFEPTLRDAMQAAIGSRGHVLLLNSAPLDVPAAGALTASRHPLVIRAGEGVRPVLRVEVKGDKPFLTTRADSPLTVEGVTFVARYVEPGAAPAAVIAAGAAVTLDRCAFRVETPTPGSRALDVAGGELTATGCWFENFDRAVDVAYYRGSTTTLRHCVVVQTRPDALASGWAVRLRGMPGGFSQKGRRLVADHCTARGLGFLEFVGFAPEGPVAVDLTACAVVAEALVSWSPGHPSREALVWSGRGDRYEVRGKSWLMTAAAAGEPASPPPADLDAWVKQVGGESEPLPPTVKFATDPAALPAEAGPADFAVVDPGARSTGADPALVGPGARPAPAPGR